MSNREYAIDQWDVDPAEFDTKSAFKAAVERKESDN